MNYYIEVFKKYAIFSGRARRAEYWYFTLFNIIIKLILIVPAIIFAAQGYTMVTIVLYGLYFLYILAVIVPHLAVTVRRLHDVGKSGWMLLIALIPIIGAIWLLVLLVKDSNPEENKYGSNPKALPSSDTVVD